MSYWTPVSEWTPEIQRKHGGELWWKFTVGEPSFSSVFRPENAVAFRAGPPPTGHPKAARRLSRR